MSLRKTQAETVRKGSRLGSHQKTVDLIHIMVRTTADGDKTWERKARTVLGKPGKSRVILPEKLDWQNSTTK